MAKRSQEIERKYEADPSTVLPDLSALTGVAAVSEPEVTTLRATYFDTPDLRLAARRISLRRRTGGSDAGWHLKLPVAPDERTEVMLPLTRPASVVPDELTTRVRVYTRRLPLAPIAQIHTHRTGRRLTDATGRVLAEVVRDRVSARTLDAPPAVTKWTEIEVELANGDRKLLLAIDRSLRDAGLRPAGSASKLLNLLSDRVPTTPDHAASQPATAAAIVGAYVRTQAERLMTYDPLVRDDAHDAVHQMRVSTRRLRSALDQFGSVIDQGTTDAISAELRWLASVLGEVRDREVLRMRLTDRLGAVSDEHGRTAVAERIAAKLGKEYDDAHATLVAQLDGGRYFALLDALDALCADPPYTATARKKGTVALEPVVQRSWKRFARRAASIKAETSDDEVHAARKAAKRFRYAVEVVSPAFPTAAKRTARAMADVQDLLGGFQDSVVARKVLSGLAADARAAGEDHFGYGVLYGFEAATARLAIRDFPAAWRKATRKASRWRFAT